MTICQFAQVLLTKKTKNRYEERSDVDILLSGGMALLIRTASESCSSSDNRIWKEAIRE